MVYADNRYYMEQFGGQEIPEAAFFTLAKKASVYIDYVTFNRLRKKTVVPDEVKDACCALAELLYHTEATDGKSIASETVGKHSVSYVEQESVQQRMYRLTSQYLAHTGLMYCGVMR